jgi:putative flippase GtrA
LQQGRLGRVRWGRFWRLVLEFASFIVVGGCAWLVDRAVFGLLAMRAGVEPQVSLLVGVVVATVVSFAGNRYWTFRQRQRTTVRGEGFRYLVLTGAGLMIQFAVVWLYADSLGLNDRVSQNVAGLLAIGVGLLFRYWSCRTWVWRALPAAPSVVA